MKKTGIKFLASMAVAVSLLGSVTLPQLKVSARAEGHYFPGVFRAEVSDYLSLRTGPSTICDCFYKIPPNARLVVTKVSKDYVYEKERMGYVKYFYDEQERKIEVDGWVNLEYADEMYDWDLVEKNYGEKVFYEVKDYVPDYYSDVSWRSQKSPYSSVKGLLYYGFNILRHGYVNGIMEENDKMSRYYPVTDNSSFYNPQTGKTHSYFGTTGYYNLDYMGTELTVKS